MISTYIQKVNLVPHFFLEMLDFKETSRSDWSSVVWHITLETDFRQIKSFKSDKYKCFILDYFHEKLNNFFSIKSLVDSKQHCFGRMHGHMNNLGLS